MPRCAMCGLRHNGPCFNVPEPPAKVVIYRSRLSRPDVAELIGTERDFQDQKHGTVETHGHTVGEWILIMESELNEAKVAILKGGTGRNRVMHEILQVVATGVAALEQHGIGDLSSKWGDR